MHINKHSEIWKSSPWHVKVSAFGLKTVRGIRIWKNTSFFTGLFGLLLSLIGLAFTENQAFLLTFFLLSPLGLSACMYWFALDWIRDNPEVLSKPSA